MIQTLTPEGLMYVLTHLRAADKREFEATTFDGDFMLSGRQIFMLPGPKWECHTPRGKPAVMGGFVSIWPGTGTLWMWGTPDWPEVRVEVSRFVTREVLPDLDKTVHRIECRTIADNKDVIRWLKYLGFQQEAVNAQFGRGREDFLLFARLANAPSRLEIPPKDQLPADEDFGRGADDRQLRLPLL